MRHILTLLLLVCLCFEAEAQRLDPAGYIYPIRGVAKLYSANFGEMRPGHFHGGIDIKTDGVEGKELVATADGYISRIVVTPSGYGRALYLTLDNGTTAVYGHLQRFRSDIDQYVQAERLGRRANSLDQSFGADKWPVKQDELIGYSGNSGSSMGPHLHFELRDTPSQRPINIVREGVIRPTDNLPPRILHIHYIEIDTVQNDGVCAHTALESYSVASGADGRNHLTRPEPIGVGRKGYFIVDVSDRRNGVNNTFGIWRITASIDGQPYYEYRMDGFSFDQTRCCDAISYYPRQVTSRNEVFRLAQLAGAPDSFYSIMTDRGIIRTDEGQIRTVRIEAEDDCGNQSQIEFTIRGRAGAFRAEADTTATLLQADRTSVAALGREATLRVPAGALYESIYCRPESTPASSSDSSIVVLSPAYRFLDTTTPLRHPATLSIRASVPRSLHLRTVVASRSPKGRLSYVGGTYADGAVNASTRATGFLCLVADTLPPRVQPLFKPGADLSQAKSLRFRVSDNFSGIASYTLTIDGEWLPCDRLPMQGTLHHTFTTPATRQKHRVQLSVTDGCGNITRWEGSFLR